MTTKNKETNKLHTLKTQKNIEKNCHR